ncbi:MAG: hypothetical protein HY521_13240 [Proteobacteria bacterium]|nr:hypothetical protein [Pseudomonadota bacterium]
MSRRLETGKLPAELLRELLAANGPAPPELLLPPRFGEDAGVVAVPAGALVAATDPITLTGRDVAAHAVVVNANDVAVMGVRPRWFLAAMLLPVGTTEDEVRALFAAMREALAGIDAVLVGGHTEVTAAVTQPVVVGQMLGLSEDGRFIRTGGVGQGDAIIQVGPAPIEGTAVLAAEAAGRLGALAPEVVRRAREALRSPGISVVKPALAAAGLGATALHDPTEGGLSSGLYEMAEASGVGLEIATKAVLWFEPGLAVCRALGADPWGVLASGTLLAAFPAGIAGAALAALRAAGHECAAIGRAVAGGGVRGEGGGPLARYERDEVARLLAG